MKSDFIYLDNAATSFPKPASVTLEVTKCLTSYCGNAGRGSNALSLLAARRIYDCREAVCTLINAPSPESIVFVPSCTSGLNLIIKGLLKQGDHVLISDMEHNSVYRPLSKLKSQGLISFDSFSALSTTHKSQDSIISGIKSKLKPNTRLLICNHQSNVCSYSLPIEKIGALCKKNHVLFAVDCAQSMGHLPINMQKMNINFLSAPAHKGLYGLQGCAFVALNSSILLDTLIEGGNGINSIDTNMGIFVPERYEAGTLPLPCIVGLREGIELISNIGITYINEHDKELFKYLRDGLLNIRGMTIYAPDFDGSTLLFNLKNLGSERVASLLDEKGVLIRSGLHCAPLAHASLGTQETGALRVSFGIFNGKRDVDKLLYIMNKVS